MTRPHHPTRGDRHAHPPGVEEPLELADPPYIGLHVRPYDEARNYDPEHTAVREPESRWIDAHQAYATALRDQQLGLANDADVDRARQEGRAAKAAFEAAVESVRGDRSQAIERETGPLLGRSPRDPADDLDDDLSLGP